MNILAIDTALDACAVAVACDGAVRAHLCESMTRGQAERIAPMAREACAAAQLAFADIERIVATAGPGSFTGVRVGLAFARGLAVALGKPCLGVSTLEALALERGADGLRGAVVATPAALYAALYAKGAAVLAPARMTTEDARAAFSEAAAGRALTVRGPGAASFAADLAHAEAEEAAHVDAASLALRAATLAPQVYPPRPLYLRAALERP